MVDLLCSSGIDDFVTVQTVLTETVNSTKCSTQYLVTKYSPAPLMLYDDQRSTLKTPRMISRKVIECGIKNGNEMEASGAC